jgi:osmotically-inducible protein OsmY
MEEGTMLTAEQSGRGVDVDSLPARLRTVAERAESRLRSNPYLALKNVSCEYCEGVLTLRGCLPTYYLKQIAQTAVARLDGVERIVNDIEVVSPASRKAWQS